MIVPLSGVFGLLAEVFLEPEADVKQRLASVIAQCPGDCPGVESLPGALGAMMDHCGSSQDQAQEFVGLFLHGNGHSTVHPYESVYTHGRLMAPECLDAWQALYKDVGIHPRSGLHIPPDHLGLELEFLAYVLGQLHIEQDPEVLSRLQEAARKSLRQHLVPFSRLFVGRLSEAEPGPYYASAGRALAEALHACAILLGPDMAVSGAGPVRR